LMEGVKTWLSSMAADFWHKKKPPWLWSASELGTQKLIPRY
jgi:hypothetical protein